MTPRTLRRVAALGLGAAGAALLGSNAWILLASRGRIHTPAQLPPTAHAPVAMVLGAQAYSDTRPSPVLAARLDLGLQLLQRGTVEKLLLTGAGHGPGPDETAAMAHYLTARGVAPDRLVLDPDGVDTHASARGAARAGHTRLIVVSQSFHLPRTVALCRAAGIDAIGAGEPTFGAPSTDWLAAEIRERFAALKAVTDVIADIVSDHRTDTPRPHHADAARKDTA